MTDAKCGLMAESKIDKLMGSLNSMGLCACNRGEKVIFVCTKKTCENFQTQNLYCMKCIDDDPSPHDHKPTFIVTTGDTFKS